MLRPLTTLTLYLCGLVAALRAEDVTFSMAEDTFRLPNGSIEFRGSAEGWRPLIWTGRHMGGTLQVGVAGVTGGFTMDGTNVNMLQPATEKQVLREFCAETTENHPKHGEIKRRSAPAIAIEFAKVSAAKGEDGGRKKGVAYAGTADLVLSIDGRKISLPGATMRITVGTARHKVNKKKVEVPRISIHAQVTCKARDLGLTEEPDQDITLDVYDVNFGSPKG